MSMNMKTDGVKLIKLNVKPNILFITSIVSYRIVFITNTWAFCGPVPHASSAEYRWSVRRLPVALKADNETNQ